METGDAIGFIGLGNMGAPMAGRLLDAGYSLVVHDAREAVAGPLVYGHRLPKPFRPSQAAGLIEQCLAKRAAERARREVFRPGPWD